MARPARIQIPGGLYHVTSRGVRRSAIVSDEDDCSVFVETLARVVPRCSWACHAYCLMTNHFHLLVETPLPNIATGMQALKTAFAQHFNRRHGTTGHVFEGRYGAVLVAKDSHLLEAARYIVLNPVRAGLCGRPEEWPWSSFLATAGLARLPSFLATGTIWPFFAANANPVAQSRYRQYVEDGMS
jgi:REP-associated tyrosine transposase